MERYEGGAQDDAEAIRRWQLVAEKGHALAQFRLGWVYYAGRGVQWDEAEAVRWWRLAADQGVANHVAPCPKCGDQFRVP